MSLERTREALLKLPRVAETEQWGNNLVYWVMDKAVGGKMFALIDGEERSPHVLSFAAGPERFHELLETEGMRPAPYFARIHWVAMERWDVLPASQLHALLAAAHELTRRKLPPRAQWVYNLPDRDYRQTVRERRAAVKATR